jgi:predicted ATP-grasp superfamily ATP-dependent carboligase
MTVLVTGTEYRTGPHVCRSLRASGVRVVGAERGGHGTLRGRSIQCPRVLRYPDPEDHPEAFIEWVVQTAAAEGADAVMPLSEDAVATLAACSRQLGDLRLAGPCDIQYAALCDKGGLGRTAALSGVDHPRTVIVPVGGPLPAGLPLPAIVKAAASSDSTGAGTSVRLAHTAPERDEAVAEMMASGADAVVQEYIEGPQWSAHLVRGADAFAGLTAVVELRCPRGAGTPSLLRVTPNPAALAAAHRLLDAVDYRGPANVQFIERDGRMYVHDVNLRPPATVAMPVAAGLDLPAMGLAAAMGRGWSAPATYRGTTYLWLEAELRHLGHDRHPVHAIADMARAAARPGAVLDPAPLDPFWMGSRGAHAARNAVRRARRVTGRHR